MARKTSKAKAAAAETRRRAIAKGHRRKFLVVVDETPEVESALAFAACRAVGTGGSLALLYVVEPGDFQHWLGVEEIAREEGMNKAKAVFRLFGRKIKAMGFEDLEAEEIIREGKKADELVKLIAEDEDIGILVLGASRDPSGPGPLVSMLTASKYVADFPIPMTIVPGGLTIDDIRGIA